MTSNLLMSEATEEQLQALAYRTLVQLDTLQKQLQAINNELSRRSVIRPIENVIDEKPVKPKLVV